MVAAFFSFAALFSAVAILYMGVGLLSTFLSLRMTVENFPAQVVGMVMGAYFAGLVLGSFLCQPIIRKVGHIRAFAVFAAIATAAVMMHGLCIDPIGWGLFRFVTGMSAIGLFMVIESWLNERTESGFRGRVFSMYMVCTYFGVGLGQLLINLGDAKGFSLFFLSGILFSMCIVPVAMTGAAHPQLPETPRFHIVALMRRSPLGLAGCFLAGLVNGAFYALGPVFGANVGWTHSQVSFMMAAAVFGGLAFQWPVGMISDRFERPLVLIAVVVSMSITSMLVALIDGHSFGLLMIAMFAFGGMAFTVYPVAVARSHDLFEPKDIVSVSSALLFCYGIGAALGPIAASSTMKMLGNPFGLFVFCSAVGLAYAAGAYYLRRQEKIETVAVADQVDFMPMKQASPIMTVIDPRAEVQEDT